MKLKPVNVNLNANSYRILFDDDWKNAYDDIKRFKTLIVTDSNVAGLYLEKWMKIFGDAEYIVFPAGEATKSLTKIEELYSFLIDKSFSRDTLIAALGGGVIGDFAGFAAATYMRGVDFLQIPTTLLAIVDASIGGKVGIDHPKGKNLIGAFYQPSAVFVDTNHLNTLPQREWICGIAEVIKYGLIIDRSIFEEIFRSALENKNPERWITPEIIRRCAELKADIVSRDEKEITGYRLILNFGHTIGHALEAETGYAHFRHGEAVAIGMAGASFMSKEIGLLGANEFDGIISLLKKIPLPEIPKALTAEKLSDSITRDKKVKSGKIRFVLLTDIGKTVVVNNFDKEIFLKTMDFSLDFVSRNY